MARIDCLFVFRSDGCDAAAHRMEMDTPGGHIDAVGGELPVGYVTYFPDEEVKVDRLFAAG